MGIHRLVNPKMRSTVPKATQLRIAFVFAVSLLVGQVLSQPAETQIAPESMTTRELLNTLGQAQFPERVSRTGQLTHALIERRWVSVEVCDLLSKRGPRDEPWLATTLLQILGTIKDPSSCETLRAFWREHRCWGVNCWLVPWQQQQAYFATHPQEWEAIRPAWKREFEWLIEQPGNEIAPILLLTAVDGWFFDPEIADSLKRMRTSWRLSRLESARLECAIYRRDRSNIKELAAALRDLPMTKPGEVISLAREFRFELFVPLLIERSKLYDVTEQQYAYQVLREITFADVDDGSWRQWFEGHSDQTRHEWLADVKNATTQEVRRAEKAEFVDESFARSLSRDPAWCAWICESINDEACRRMTCENFRPTLDPENQAARLRLISILNANQDISKLPRVAELKQTLQCVTWGQALEEPGLRGIP